MLQWPEFIESSFTVASFPMWQSNDLPIASGATVPYMGRYDQWRTKNNDKNRDRTWTGTYLYGPIFFRCLARSTTQRLYPARCTIRTMWLARCLEDGSAVNMVSLMMKRLLMVSTPGIVMTTAISEAKGTVSIRRSHLSWLRLPIVTVSHHFCVLVVTYNWIMCAKYSQICYRKNNTLVYMLF